MPEVPVEPVLKAPVEYLPGDDPTRAPAVGAGLCLSGGGYRAMLFHVGALWRLYQVGLLNKVDRISSVSGGSIPAGVLALHWHELSFNPPQTADFVSKLVEPIRDLARRTIDWKAAVLGIALPGRIGDKVAAAYEKHLFHGKTLQDLPDHPRFVINATNVQTGVLWRFMKPYMRDYLVGEVKKPRVPLAQAVAASSAFPPFLSPFALKLDPQAFTPNSGKLQDAAFRSKAILTDGGVYDNLGLETVWKRYQTVLVSDGGGALETEEDPAGDWARHGRRIVNMVDRQVRALRKRQVIGSFKARAGEATHRTGAYWGIRTNIADYKLTDVLNCPPKRTLELAEIPTRLARLDDALQERLINWGYAVCDAAVRRHVDTKLGKGQFPYTRGV